jgi:hypothetical protein
MITWQKGAKAKLADLRQAEQPKPNEVPEVSETAETMKGII